MCKHLAEGQTRSKLTKQLNTEVHSQTRKLLLKQKGIFISITFRQLFFVVVFGWQNISDTVLVHIQNRLKSSITKLKKYPTQHHGLSLKIEQFFCFRL